MCHLERVQGETVLLPRKRCSVHKERMEMKFTKFAFAAALCALFAVQAEILGVHIHIDCSRSVDRHTVLRNTGNNDAADQHKAFRYKQAYDNDHCNDLGNLTENIDLSLD